MKEPKIEDYQEDDDFPHKYIKDMELWENEIDKSPHFYVDIPKVDSDGNPSEEWYNVGTFSTRKEAIEYAKEYFGADDEGKVSLISQS